MDPDVQMTWIIAGGAVLAITIIVGAILVSQIIDKIKR